ncbi:hypothetical protein OG21DRAFT_1486921 [Imleria badia]|nr:hypothetical protein OG21DRAFT_1486921 [Imleria badia]
MSKANDSRKNTSRSTAKWSVSIEGNVFLGTIILDVFVRQCESVVDYHTQWSCVRSTDLAGSAKPSKEVHHAVVDLIKDRILVGHAIYHDLKALLLSHPTPQIRDTQSLAYKHRVSSNPSSSGKSLVS